MSNLGRPIERAERVSSKVSASSIQISLASGRIRASRSASPAGKIRSRRDHQVWVEVVALAACGDPACQSTVASVTAGWSEWLQGQLRIPRSARPAAAAAVIAVVDGLVLLQLTGRDDLVADASRFLVRWRVV